MKLVSVIIIHFIILILLLTLTSVKAFLAGSTWAPELKDVKANTSNSDLLNFDNFRAHRVSRGVFKASGKFTVNFDIVEGDSNELEILSFYSENGVKEYDILPFHIYRQHLFKIFDTVYKDSVMHTFSECSNLPVFKDRFIPPFEKKVYFLDECEFDQRGFPDHFKNGFYKAMAVGYGDVEWSMTFIFEIERR